MIDTTRFPDKLAFVWNSLGKARLYEGRFGHGYKWCAVVYDPHARAIKNVFLWGFRSRGPDGVRSGRIEEFFFSLTAFPTTQSEPATIVSVKGDLAAAKAAAETYYLEVDVLRRLGAFSPYDTETYP